MRDDDRDESDPFADAFSYWEESRIDEAVERDQERRARLRLAEGKRADGLGALRDDRGPEEED